MLKKLVFNLKVALISEEFPPFTFGGKAAVCYDLAHSLSEKKVPTTVFCGRSSKMAIEKPNAFLDIIRLPCIDIPPRSIWFQIQNLHIFSRLLKDYTIIHVVAPASGTICSYLKKNLHKPLVTSTHGVMRRELEVFINSPISYWTIGDFGFNLLEYPLYHFLDKIILRNSDHIVACSFSLLQDMKNVYGDITPDKASVIYNGITLKKIDNIKSNSDDSKQGLTINYFGRLFWRKGLIYLIRAIANLKTDLPELKLQLFGKGPLKSQITKEVSKLGLKDKVHLRGHVSYEELIKEIKRGDAVVLPSLYEAQPVSALEAMACKKPLITFDFPFSREFIVDKHNGLLAKGENVKDLSDKISLLLSDKKLRSRLGQNAYDYVKRNHNWNSLVDKYINLYENVMSTKD